MASEYVEQGFDLEQWPQHEAVPSSRSNGVILTFSEEYLDYLLSTIQRWFSERSEVILMSYGTTDKRGLGCMVMEWDSCEIDRLFLDILRTDENIIDYAAYPIDQDEED